MSIPKDSKRILSVIVKRTPDYEADSSDLGEFSDKPNDYAIVQENARGEYAGRFVHDLPCECGHEEAQHNDDMVKSVDVGCMADDCSCDYFDRVEIERGREYRYFNPPISNYEGESDEDLRKYSTQDYERMRGLQNNDWCYMGVTAKAEVAIPDGGRTSNGPTSIVQTIHSGSLWGIESDSDESYFTQIEGEQLDELKDQLHAIGFTKRAISAAFRNVEHKG